MPALPSIMLLNRVIGWAIEININEGDSARIAAINLIGAKAFSQKELIKLFQLKKTHLTSFFKNDDKYAREKLMGDLETLRSFYLDRGYINFTLNSHQVTLSQDKKSVFIDISFTEGEKYQFGDVKILGELPVAEAELRKLILFKKDMTYSQQLVTASSKLIKQRLGTEGYLFSEINPIPDIDVQKKQVSLSFLLIQPNKPMCVASILKVMAKPMTMFYGVKCVSWRVH
jgi:outer membrane protein insertion porin family